MNTASTTWRNVAHQLLESRVRRSPASDLIGRFIVTLIVLNGLAVVLESNPRIFAACRDYFFAFEVFSVSIFTLEYIARLWAAAEHPRFRGTSPWRARLRYAIKPMAIVDLLAIAPFYLSLLIPIDLRYLRLFRLLRLVKLSHYFNGLHVFASVLRREAGAIAGALLIMLILIVISACLMFSVENSAQPGQFGSVAQAIWWAVVTLTTAGYGDVSPVTLGGKLLGIAIMLLGIGTMALPAGILAARFSEELQGRREVLRGQVRDALADGRLDPTEQRSLERLQEELGLSSEELDRLVALQSRFMKRHRFCPHCGESLADDA